MGNSILKAAWNYIKDAFGALRDEARLGYREDFDSLITMVKSLKNKTQFMGIVNGFESNNLEKGASLRQNLQTDNFLFVLMDALKTDKYLLAPNLFTVVGKIFVLLSRLRPIMRNRLVELNIAEKFVGLIEKMDELGFIIDDEDFEWKFLYNTNNTKFEFSIAHLLIYFIPKVSNYKWFSEAVFRLKSYEMIGDFEGDVHYINNILKPFISKTFMTIYRICQKPAYLNCYSYHVLLMKMTYWALHLGTCDLSGIGIANYLKMALNSDCKKTVISAVGIIDSVLDKFPLNTVKELCAAGISDELHNLKWVIKAEKPMVLFVRILASLQGSILRMEAKLRFMAEIYFNRLEDTSIFNTPTNYIDIKTSPLDDEIRILADIMNCISDPEKMKQYKESEVVDFFLKFIMIRSNDDGKKLVKERYSKLNQFMAVVLNIDNQARHQLGILKVDPKGIDNFRHLVLYVNNFLEKQVIEEIYPCGLDNNPFIDISIEQSPSYKNVNLGLERLAPLTRVLGRSKYGSLLKSSSQLKAHRLKSIMIAVNEYWGVLFQNLATERLIPLNLFTNKTMVNKLNKVMKSAQPIPPWAICYACNFNDCQYTLPLEMRIFLFKCIKELQDLYNNAHKPKETCIYHFERDKPVTQVANNLKLFNDLERPWAIVYENAMGSGPTKEFYTEFSRDCYRKKLNIWIDDESSSNDYINPPAGLFPSPCPMSIDSENSLTAIGLVLNKSILDSKLLNIHFSDVFLKRIFAFNHQAFKLTDLKYVVPSVYAFAEKLVDVLKLKQMILENKSLTLRQQSKAVAALKFDGCSFEDLSINFTLPKYPHIEMISGGRNVMLSPTNIEDYLKLLIWWFLYQGPAEKFDILLDCYNGDVVNDPLYKSLFRIDELTELYFGRPDFSHWTIEILSENCKLVDPLSRESPLVKYLFQVLTDLTQTEKGRFLEFVTSSPTLPIGGFQDLSPPLTISIINTDKPDDRLPTARTCFNLLQIPNYSSADILKERLQLAISEGIRIFNYT